MSTDLATQTPVEIDTVLFPLLAERYHQASRAAEIRRTLAKTIWPAEFVERYERYLGKFDKRIVHPVAKHYGWEQTVNNYNDRLRDCEAKIEALRAAIAPLEEEFDRRPWSRFLLVSGGHIHLQSERCGSIRPTTQVGWIIEASGMEPDEVVRKYSYTACTKCFPDAPVAEYTPEPGVCTAGPYDHTKKHRADRYTKCNGCGYWGAVTTTGKLRKHKIPEAAS